MNLRHLRVFHAAAQAGGVTAGAERLNISQPAASREIRTLEERLGIALLHRGGRSLALTEAGRVLRGYADRIFALEQAAEAELRELAGLGGGHLVIGASNTLGNHVLPPLLADFHASHPGIDATLLIGNSEEVAAWLLDERLSLGFVEGPLADERFAGAEVGHDRIVAVASTGHPLALRQHVSAADLADGVAFAREPGSGTRANVDMAYARLGLTFRPALTMGSAEALRNLLLAGGVAWMPRLAVLGELRSGRLVELQVDDLVIERPLSLIYRRDRSPSPAAAAFLELVRRRL